MENMVLLIGASRLKHNSSESTRMCYISKILNKYGIPTKIIGRKSELGDDIKGDNIIAIKPILKGFKGELLFRLQLQIFVFQKMLFSKKINNVIMRGRHLIFLEFILKLMGKKIIYDFHGYTYKDQEAEGSVIRSKITKIFDKLKLAMADYIIVVSEGIAAQIPKRYKQKIIFLPNGVDLDLFKNDASKESKYKTFEKYKLPIDKKLVGFIGKWGPWINIKDILDASLYCNNIQILIVGKGYDYEQLSELTKNNPSITWTGMVDHDESIKLLKLTDICITPYTKDIYYANEPGFFQSRKNKEYLAAGKPIIMSNIKGREQFLESENILLYEPGNPEDLANKIKLLMRDELLYQKIRENNKKLSKEFSWERLLEKSGLIFILKGSN